MKCKLFYVIIILATHSTKSNYFYFFFMKIEILDQLHESILTNNIN